tara:strand:+ start:1703 stop:1951 length:249 start_codon:yes stop_codon:yes gene_type:complete
MRAGDLVSTRDGEWYGIVVGTNASAGPHGGRISGKLIYRVLWTYGSYSGKKGWSDETTLKVLSSVQVDEMRNQRMNKGYKNV